MERRYRVRRREEIERVQERYLRWVLGVGRYTLGFMIVWNFRERN